MKKEPAHGIVSISSIIVPNVQNYRKDIFARSAACLDTSFATVQLNTPLGILEVASHVKDTYAGPVGVNYIISLTAQWRINMGHMVRVEKEDHQRRLDVRPVFLSPSSLHS